MKNINVNRLISKPFFNLSLKTNATKINIEEKLRKSLNRVNLLDVSTLNGDCGQSFLVRIQSPEFLGKTLLDQHRLVNEIIKDEVKVAHSVVLQTRS